MGKQDDATVTISSGGATATVSADRFWEITDGVRLSRNAHDAAYTELGNLLQANWLPIWQAYQQHKRDNPGKKYTVALGVCIDSFGANCVRVKATISYGTKRSDETEGLTVGNKDQPELDLDNDNA